MKTKTIILILALVGSLLAGFTAKAMLDNQGVCKKKTVQTCEMSSVQLITETNFFIE